MPSDPPMTDEEVCRKFGITVSDARFAVARRLSDNRTDRVICEAPDCKCPHCRQDFAATFYDLGSNDPANGNELPCPVCERIIYIECISEPEDGNESGAVHVILSTDPEPTP